jgi:hypothetical protein
MPSAIRWNSNRPPAVPGPQSLSYGSWDSPQVMEYWNSQRAKDATTEARSPGDPRTGLGGEYVVLVSHNSYIVYRIKGIFTCKHNHINDMLPCVR